MCVRAAVYQSTPVVINAIRARRDPSPDPNELRTCICMTIRNAYLPSTGPKSINDASATTAAAAFAETIEKLFPYHPSLAKYTNHISPAYGCKYYTNYKPAIFSSHFSIPLSIEANKFKMIYIECAKSGRCGERSGDAHDFSCTVNCIRLLLFMAYLLNFQWT